MSTNIIQQKTPIIQVKMYDTKIFQMGFGQWLKNTRTDKRVSGVELERLSGVSRQYISNLERELKSDFTGKIVQPSPEIVDKLATALGADVDEARLAAGYAPKKVLPSELAIMDFDGFDDEDLQDIAEYVAFKRAQKNKGKNNME